MLDFRRSRVRSSAIDIHAAKEGEFSLLHLDVIFYIHLIAKSENKKEKGKFWAIYVGVAWQR